MNFVLNSMGLILINVYTNDRGQTGIWLTVGTDEMVFGRCFSGEWHGILDFFVLLQNIWQRMGKM